MRNFFMTFFFRERARTKNRSIRWLLPLSSWGRGWQLVGKKLYILKHVQLYIHTAIYTISNSSIPYTNNIPVSIMIFSVISFEFSNREVENYCNVHITKFQKKFWFRTNSNTQHLLLVLKEQMLCVAVCPEPK